MDVTVAPYANIPHLYGSPIKLFEYMAMAKPVVASRTGQLAEVIQHRQNGVLVDPGNEHQLAEAILELAGDKELRDRLGRKARWTVEE